MNNPDNSGHGSSVEAPSKLRAPTGRSLDRLVRHPWPSADDYDNETCDLIQIVDHGWDFQWPGWQWVANRLNARYGNNRTAAACRAKFARLRPLPNSLIERNSVSHEQANAKLRFSLGKPVLVNALHLAGEHLSTVWLVRTP